MKTVLLCGRGMENFGAGLGSALNTVVMTGLSGRFADGEVRVQGVVGEGLVGGRVLVIVGQGASGLVEGILMADAARRAGAGEVVAVLPYLAYARQDRVVEAGEPVSAAVVAGMLNASFDRVIVGEVHSAAALGFFNGRAWSVGVLEAMGPRVAEVMLADRVCVVSPDAGGVVRAQAFARRLEELGCQRVELAVIDKRRGGAGEVASARLVGEVAGCHCVLVDDILDSAGTLCAAAEALRLGDAAAVSAVAVHGLFSTPAVDRLLGGGLERLWVSDTVPLREEVRELKGLEVIAVAGVFAEHFKG